MTNRAEIVMTAVDKATAVINRISDRMDRLSNQSNLSRAFERLGNTAGLTRINNGLAKMGGNLRNVALYGGIAAGAVAAMFSKSVGALDDFGDSMAVAGVRGKQLVEVSALRDFMVEFGITSDDATKSVVKLTGNMSAARAGMIQQKAAFEAAGITMEDLKKKTPIEVMQKMMDVFSQSDKAGAKIKIMEILAGKSSVKMVDAMSQGSQAFTDYKEKFKNALLTEKDYEGADKAASSISHISELVSRAMSKMSTAAAPHLQAFLERNESGLLELIPKLVDWTERFIASLDGDKIGQFFSDVGAVFSAIGGALRWLGENVNATLLTITALGLVFAPSIAAMTSIGMVIVPRLISAFTKLGVALMANPIFLAIGLLAGAAYLVYKNWDGIVGGLKAMWEDLGDALAAVWAFFTGAAGLAINKVANWFTGLYDGFIGVWNKITGWFSEKLGKLTAMLPNWMTGGSVDVNVKGAPPQPVQTSAQTIANGRNKTEVGGRIHIEVSGAPVKVTEMSSRNSAVPIDFRAGVYGAGT